MTEWSRRRLRLITSLGAGVGIILDPDGVVDLNDVELDGIETSVADDWWSLRRVWETKGRRRSAELRPLALVVRGAAASTALPWDIEGRPAALVGLRLPGPAAVRRVLANLSPVEFDQVINTAEDSNGSPEAILEALLGVSVSGHLDLAGQLRLCCRIVVRPDAESLASLASRSITIPELRELIQDRNRSHGLDARWAAALRGEDQGWSAAFEASAPEIGMLFATGVLAPVVCEQPPAWANVGVRSPGDDERVRALLAQMPVGDAPTTAAGWIDVAAWWAEVRSLLPRAIPETRDRSWLIWADLDRAFNDWLRVGYGSVLNSATRWPSALHRVADSLARRLRDGDAERLLLIVLDGLGLAQWAHLRSRLGFEFEEGSTFSMIPTYTTVSRQAIFAGELPLTFHDSIWTTSREPARWREFWAAQGLPVTAVAYHRVLGRFPLDRIDFGAKRVVGVVVNAVDELMHSSELFGDTQLLAGLDVWTDNGFLPDIIRRATDAGFETWITADHGNLECTGTRVPSEGVALESAGKRLLRFANRELRDATKAEGLAWDDAPGLGETVGSSLMYAAGRSAYTSNALSVSHGGLSLDEVIVPLVRVVS